MSNEAQGLLLSLKPPMLLALEGVQAAFCHHEPSVLVALNLENRMPCARGFRAAFTSLPFGGCSILPSGACLCRRKTDKGPTLQSQERTLHEEPYKQAILPLGSACHMTSLSHDKHCNSWQLLSTISWLLRSTMSVAGIKM